MNEQERALRIRLMREALQTRSLENTGLPACAGCGDPFGVHKKAPTGELVCMAASCNCRDYQLPRVPDQVELACDEMFDNLREFRRDHSDLALHKLAKTVRKIESMFFEPFFINRGKGIQLCSKKRTWIAPSTTANACSKAFPRDEPGFYTNTVRRRDDGKR